MGRSVKKYHKISIDDDTYAALQQRAAYINRLIDKPVSAAMTIRWLACGKLKIKTEAA